MFDKLFGRTASNKDDTTIVNLNNYRASVSTKTKPAPVPTSTSTETENIGVFHPYYIPLDLLNKFMTFISYSKFTHYEKDIHDFAPRPYPLIIMTVTLNDLPTLILIEDEFLVLDLIQAHLTKNCQFTFLLSPDKRTIHTIKF